jgi:formylglycine-generating enzyme required for sulfatase activity
MVYHLLSKQLKNNHDIFHLYKNKALSMLNDDQTLFEKLDPKLYDDLEVATIAMKYDNRRYLKLSDRLKKDDQMIKMYMNIPMIFIKGGSFIMRNGDGHNHEKLENKLTIEDFYMSKTEITTEQYMKCVDANICSKPHWDDGKCYMWDKSGGWVRDVLDVKFREENKPIVCVDWRQARTFAKWVGGHLPSEAQWEYASRSEGKDIKYPWGNTAPMCDIVNSHYDCHETTTPVCSKIEGNTIQGLCDMGGNVWEWMLEYENVIISRGGGWGDISSYLQSTLHYSDFNFNSNLHGFRIADTSPLMP